MANINVGYGEMEQAAAQLGAGREEIVQQLNVLQSVISNLVTTAFVTDQASGRFNAFYTEYTASATAFMAKLSEIQQFLVQTTNVMRDTDAQIAARIG